MSLEQFLLSGLFGRLFELGVLQPAKTILNSNKELLHVRISNVTQVVAPNSLNRLETFWDGVTVTEIKMCSLEFRNAGNLLITDKDIILNIDGDILEVSLQPPSNELWKLVREDNKYKFRIGVLKPMEKFAINIIAQRINLQTLYIDSRSDLLIKTSSLQR